MQTEARPVREKILAAAVQLFAEYGYHASTMRDIARVTGIQAASIYYHYVNKQALLVEIMDTHMRTLNANLERIVQKQAPIRQRLHEAIASHIRLHTTYKAEFFIIDTEIRALEGEYRTAILALRDRYESLVQELLETVLLTVLLFGVAKFSVQNFQVDGVSMVPTLQNNEMILVDKVSYHFHNGLPSRGDIIVFHAPPATGQSGRDFIKRVIGLPGDTVAVMPDTLLVDGKPAFQLNDCAGDPDANFQHTPQRGLRWPDREQSPWVQNNALFENGKPWVVVTPSGRAEIRGGQLWANGQRLTSVGGPGRYLLSDLSSFGAVPSVQGSAYYLSTNMPDDDQPTAVVLKGKRLTLRPGWVSINGRALKEPYARQSWSYLRRPHRYYPPASTIKNGAPLAEKRRSRVWRRVREQA